MFKQAKDHLSKKKTMLICKYLFFVKTGKNIIYQVLCFLKTFIILLCLGNRKGAALHLEWR